MQSDSTYFNPKTIFLFSVKKIKKKIHIQK